MDIEDECKVLLVDIWVCFEKMEMMDVCVLVLLFLFELLVDYFCSELWVFVLGCLVEGKMIVFGLEWFVVLVIGVVFDEELV